MYYVGPMCNHEIVTDFKSKIASAESESESNYSDGELWLCAAQKTILRRSKKLSKKMSKKKQEKELQDTDTQLCIGTIKPKVKPATFPKPKKPLVIGCAGATGKSLTHKDQKLKGKSPKGLLRLASDGNDYHR